MPKIIKKNEIEKVNSENDKKLLVRETKTKRSKRIPIYKQYDENTQNIDKDPNFYYRWINEGHNIKAALKAYYEFVTEDNKQISRSDRAGITQYLMRIPLEYWLEDQAKKQDKIDIKEADIKGLTRDNMRSVGQQDDVIRGNVKVHNPHNPYIKHQR